MRNITIMGLIIGSIFILNAQMTDSQVTTNISGQASQIEYPIVIVKATFGEPTSVDPASAYEVTDYEVIQNVYETLVRYEGSKTTVVPWLAESWTMSSDGLTYTFILRRGIKFTDGTDFNADIVVYSLRRSMKMRLTYSYLLTDYIYYSGIKKIDDYTVSITTKFPYAGFLQILAHPITAMVSKKAVEEHGGIVEGKQNEWMDRNAVGTGPFILESWEPKNNIVLVKNENYWGGPKGTGLAKPDKVIIRQIEDDDARILALKTGGVDIATDAPQSGWKGITIDKIGIDPGINYISFNLRSSKYPMFQDKNVRAAIAHSINYNDIINKIQNGRSVRERGPLPVNIFGHNPNLYLYDYNINKAKQYLAQSKYPNGFKTTIAYYTGNNLSKQTAFHLRDQLAQLSIEVEVTGFDESTFLEKRETGELPMWIQRMEPDFADPDSYVQPFFHSQGRLAKCSRYSDNEMDKLVEAGQREMDLTKRKEIYYDIQTKSMDDYVYVWTTSTEQYAAYKDDIQGIEYNNMFGGILYYSTTKTSTPLKTTESPQPKPSTTIPMVTQPPSTTPLDSWWENLSLVEKLVSWLERNPLIRLIIILASIITVIVFLEDIKRLFSPKKS